MKNKFQYHLQTTRYKFDGTAIYELFLAESEFSYFDGREPLSTMKMSQDIPSPIRPRVLSVIETYLDMTHEQN